MARLPDAGVLAAAPPAPDGAGRPWKRALAWLVFLGPFFFASYGFANWIASRRAEVAVIAFDWERHIPFLPWTIAPYWSIDLFYGVSLFICTSRHELDVHARRLLCAQLVCVAVFLLFPLRFSFERPNTHGVFGAMFDALMGLDKPFNQMPSLHIGLLVIIAVRYLAHVRGIWPGVVHVWSALIVISVLTTYQHHFIDIPTGVWVGWLCIWLFPEQGRSPLVSASVTRDTQRRKLGAAYLAGAGVLALAAVYAGGWALWLLWIAGALALVAVIYTVFDEYAFQKAPKGSISMASWWLLWPYFAGAWLNSRWWTRAHPGASAIVPGLYLGRMPARSERRAYGTIVDMCAELPCEGGCERYMSVPQLDLIAPSVSQIETAAAAIDASYGSGPVLVCCALGYSRSAVAIAAWLLASGRARTPPEAVNLIRRARPSIVIGRAHLVALEQFAGAHKRHV